MNETFRTLINNVKNEPEPRKVKIVTNDSPEKDDTTKKEDYQIAISQDGKFIVTFDTENLRIKILKNTDHRPLTSSKKEVNSSNSSFMSSEKKVNSSNENESDEPDYIDKTIAYFKINNDFTINKFYSTDYEPLPFEKSEHGVGVVIT
ncbi:hypothetical protein GLOIN_2v1475226 [Rhizophagus clarus]|uniref:Uncharacterized protein n=1 Tax=Rhizophagus clarus TaxID=94130 RepID=A0A8H3QPT9_9GLOM|nr:hypothetical protein GLOIN_2v1475226 [Rhizophagus clarus]